MKKAKYFFKAWVYVMGLLALCHLGALAFNEFMDWVITFTEEQIVVGILVFASAVTAATMTWLKYARIL